MKLNKKILFFTLCGLLLVPAFAQSNNQGDSQALENIKQGGSQLLKGLGEALQGAGESLDKAMKSYTAQACAGKWIFKNGKCTTTIDCHEDGTMSVVLKGKISSVTYRGTFESTMSQIVFTATEKETATGFFKNSEKVNECWKIDIKVSNKKEMKLSSDSIPDDENGYDFSNPTVFVIVE